MEMRNCMFVKPRTFRSACLRRVRSQISHSLIFSFSQFLILIFSFSQFLILFTSCGNWLDVGSKSEVDEDEMYQTQEGYYTTLTGLYLNLGSTSLYGGNLSLTVLEPLTQQYTISDDEPDRQAWSQFNYVTDGGQKWVADIWLTMYNTIVNCNMLLQKLDDADRLDFEPGVVDVMRGEALGLRALMYFDLVRLFNDNPTKNPGCRNVPMKTDFGFSLGQQVTTAELLDRLAADLNDARRLLVADPLKSGRPINDRYVGYDRSQRMNYYAVTALLARLELYRQHYEAAAGCAEEVMAARHYRFIRPEEVLVTDAYGAELQADRIFMPEQVFALYTENILTTSRSTYEGLTRDFVKSTNAYSEGDVREAWFFSNPSALGKINLIRYQRSIRPEDQSRYADPVVPMLKLSEMYLIAAECALQREDDGQALDLLNTLRTARGEAELPVIATADELRDAITHEYQCDFRGEGQLFYYYKRMGFTHVDDGFANGNTVSVSPSAYTLPLPEYEIQFGYGKN